MTPEEIVLLVESVAKKRLDAWNWYSLYRRVDKIYKEPDYPDYYSCYGMCIELMECNRYHAEKGVFPAKLFRHKSPSQTEEEFTYVKNNYKQVTLPVFIDYVNTISMAFNEGNYSISYQQDDDTYRESSLQQYLEEEIDVLNSLFNYIKFILPTVKTIDANGVIAVKNFFPVEVNESGEVVVSSTELNRPQPIYYDCSRVIAYKDEEYCLIETTPSEYKKDKKKKSTEILTYEFYDLNNVYYIHYDVHKKRTELILYDKHEWGRLPVTKLKGVPKVVDSEVVWQSPFSFATDILDIVAVNNSTLDIATKKCAYPIRVYVGRPCLFEYKDKEGSISVCSNGQCYDSVLAHNIQCPSCGGTGLKDRFSPLHDYILNAGDSLTSADHKAAAKPFEYVSPSSEILKFLEDNISKNEEKARMILHIHNSNSVIQGTENLTATGMGLEQKSKYAFVKTHSDQMFDIWRFIVDAIGWYRYKTAYKPPTITSPNTFDFNTEWDYINEISAAIRSGLAPVMIHELMIRYLKSYFFTEETTTRAFKLVIATDKLLGLSQIDISTYQNKGLVAGWEIVIHNSALSLIDDLFKANPNFFEQEILMQEQQLIDLAKKTETENKPVQNTQDVIGSLLNQTA